MIASDVAIAARLALIADGFTDGAIADRVVAAVEVGVRWVHLRDHEAAPTVFEEKASALTRRLRALSDDVLLSINGFPDLAAEMGVGLHLGQRGPLIESVRARRGRSLRIGFSAHETKEGIAAVAAGTDYLFFSPIFPTSSKPGHPGVGIVTLKAFCAAVAPVPVFALGGISPDRVSACLDAGVYGVAILGGILRAPDPAAAVHRYLQAVLE